MAEPKRSVLSSTTCSLLRKLIAAMMIFLVSSLPVHAGGNTVIEEGKFTYKIRFDAGKGFTADCKGKTRTTIGGHVNLEIWKHSTKMANWHLGWDGQCLVAWDSKSNRCEVVCEENEGKGKLRYILKKIKLPNSAIDAIEDNPGATTGLSDY